jgi:protein-tyrosine-phosphatase
MEDFQFDIISDKYPHSVRKMHLFLDYCLDKPGDLVDPMGKSDKVFLAAFSKIKEGVDRLFAKLITG